MESLLVLASAAGHVLTPDLHRSKERGQCGTQNVGAITSSTHRIEVRQSQMRLHSIEFSLSKLKRSISTTDAPETLRTPISLVFCSSANTIIPSKPNEAIHRCYCYSKVTFTFNCNCECLADKRIFKWKIARLFFVRGLE